MAVPTVATISQWPTNRWMGDKVSEIAELTGGAGNSAAGDTVAYTPRFLQAPEGVTGPASYTISGRVVTLKLEHALIATDKIQVVVWGRV